VEVVVSVTVKHSPALESLDPVYAEVLGRYSARKHHMPVTLTVNGSEVALDEGGDPACGVRAVVMLTSVPPLEQRPVLAGVSWLGLQMKKVTVPVTGPPPSIVALMTALSVTFELNVVLPPLPVEGVVFVVVGIGMTVKHSPELES
jgi:hypothetical protein